MTITGTHGVSDATSRLGLRRRRGRRRQVLLIVLAVVLAGLLGGLTWLVGFSEVLAVRTVAVQGARTVAVDDVRRLAEVPLGTPLARVDLDAVATRIAGLPAVQRVTVARQWPGALSITLTERTAQFAIETPGGYWIADADGVIFRAVAEPPASLMRARVPTGDARLVRDLATVLRALPAGLRAQVEQVRADTADTIELRLRNRTAIIWGSAEQSALKAQVIVPLLRQKGTLFDVSAPSVPTVR